ncbi:hypothetical protein PRIPAC_88612, partial [Pristionchus pacificus]
MDVLEHCCSDKHVDAMNGAVCADAFMFWWMAVEEATIDHPAPLNMIPARRSVPFPYVSAPPSVDPLALLESCKKAKRKMPVNEIGVRFPELRARFDLCDPKRMVRHTDVIFGSDDMRFKECFFCEKDVTFKMMIKHICSLKHLEAMNGAVCADAFDFWWRAVEAADGVQLTPDGIPQISPPPNVDPFALLQSCQIRFPLMAKSAIEGRFEELLARFD